MKYNPNRDLPQFARELKTLSPSKLAEHILNRRNKKIGADAITHWFSRHPDIYEQLSKELVQGLPTEKEEVESSMFENGNFQEIASIKEWLLYMNTRRGHKGKPLHPEYVKDQIRLLRWACRKFTKHPDRMTFRDAQEIFLALEKDENYLHWEGDSKVKGMDTAILRRAIKDFLKSKGASDWEKIGVGKPSGFGKYKNLWVEQEIVLKMLDWITEQDFKIGTIDWIMYSNGIRISAVLTSQIEKFKRDKEWDYLTVLEKFRETPTFKIVKQVGDMIAKCIGERKEGKIFIDVNAEDVGILNRKALKQFLPELEPKIHMPNHFFRHICAQTLRKLTGGNTGLCAAIMRCSKQSFDESYGGQTDQEVEAGENKFLPLVVAPTVEVKA